MSLLKYIDRINSIHRLIESEHTGTSEEFASRLGISRSLLMEHLQELRESFGAKILFCRRRQTFYYSQPFNLVISFSSKVMGGSRCSVVNKQDQLFVNNVKAFS
jgi:hypothetical protein